MKTSLLLMSLVMGAGLVGTAQAASTTAASSIPDVHKPALVATSVSGSGVLSTLGDLLSGKTTKKHDSLPPCDHDAMQPTDKAKQPCQSQAAAHPGASNPHAHLSAGGADTQRSANGGNPLPSSASSAEAVLGWQSLLPGSIQ